MNLHEAHDLEAHLQMMHQSLREMSGLAPEYKESIKVVFDFAVEQYERETGAAFVPREPHEPRTVRASSFPYRYASLHGIGFR